MFKPKSPDQNVQWTKIPKFKISTFYFYNNKILRMQKVSDSLYVFQFIFMFFTFLIIINNIINFLLEIYLALWVGSSLRLHGTISDLSYSHNPSRWPSARSAPAFCTDDKALICYGPYECAGRVCVWAVCVRVDRVCAILLIHLFGSENCVRR